MVSLAMDGPELVLTEDEEEEVVGRKMKGMNRIGKRAISDAVDLTLVQAILKSGLDARGRRRSLLTALERVTAPDIS
ncbi:hypothetical protein IEQ34_022310 [Dendrobium chrysotoxum]|uniref:Uncharacterized protein n=1 Tax=Dendrobium chrysotoxum TaxID=161865 RepID=A0AAV7FX58_DENCH|nr:hypothetical protein IEQ34_022310 [Dendrobium chrysotoxum]